MANISVGGGGERVCRGHGVLICSIVTWLCKPSSSCSSRRTHALLLFPVCACTGTVPWPRLLGWCAACLLHRHPLLRLFFPHAPGWCFGTGMSPGGGGNCKPFLRPLGGIDGMDWQVLGLGACSAPAAHLFFWSRCSSNCLGHCRGIKTFVKHPGKSVLCAGLPWGRPGAPES